MSTWYAIVGVSAVTYLLLAAWILVEAINAPLIDDASAGQVYRVAKPTAPRLPRGRRFGLRFRHGRASGRAA